MDRLADETFARDGRAVEPQPVDAGDAEPARIAAADDLGALARAVEIDPAQLQALPDLPDAVEHQAVPLIGFGQRSFAANILRDRERHFGEAADRRRIPVPETGQRVGERRLPVTTHALGEI